MKPILITLVVILTTIKSSSQSNFERGFVSGYSEGYCFEEKTGCISPLPPPSPLPDINESSSSYRDGYNRGFKMGQEAKNGNSNSTRRRYKTASAEPIDFSNSPNMNELLELASLLNNMKQQCLKLSEQGRHQESIELALQGHKMIPTDEEFLILIYGGYIQLKDYKNALKYLKKAERISPNSTQKLLIKQIKEGTIENNSNNNSTQKTDNDETTKLEIIEKFYNEKDYQFVVKFCTKLIETEPKAIWYSKRAMVYNKLKKYPEAISDYSKAIEIKSTPNLLFDRGLTKLYINDLYGAINDFESIINGDVPPNQYDMATVINNKAYCLVKLKKYNDAKKVIEQAITMNSKHWFIWDTRGELNYQIGNFQQTLEDCSKAIEIKPNGNSYYYRGLARIKLGNTAGGCVDLSKSSELGFKDAISEIQKYCN